MLLNNPRVGEVVSGKWEYIFKSKTTQKFVGYDNTVVGGKFITSNAYINNNKVSYQ
jgi:hypothetical protein